MSAVITADFSGQVVVVTGAASGIGAATIRRFIEAGATAVGCDIAGEQIEGSAGWGIVDVGDESSVGEFVERVRSEFGRIDVVVNVAGVGVQSDSFIRTHELTLPQWQRVIDVNLTGSFLMARAALPSLIETKGVLVNIASVYGLAAAPGTIAYASSKHGVIGLTRGIALEYALDGVRAVAVCPGFTRTPMVEHHMEQSGDPEGEMARVASLHPMGRLAEPSEIADAVFWAASDSAGFVTGSAVVVDGGLLAQ